MRKSLLCFCLLCLSIVARGQTSYEYAYWVDNTLASGRMSVTSGDSWQTDIDVSYLNEGFHSLHVQVRDEKGRWSAPVTRYFYKLPKTDNLVYRYWFDTDNETLVCNNEEVMWLDVSKLDDGMHTLHIQPGDEVSTSVVNFHFLKIPQVVGVDYMTCLCYIDGNLYHQERVAQMGDVLPWTFDVSGMEEGIHSIRIQVVSPAGVASSVYESMFVRSITDDELASLDFLYTIDDKEGEVCEGVYVDGAYHFDLDVSALEDGIHKLSYTLVGEDGISTKFVSRFFVKSPLGGSGITQYWYWVNDNNEGKKVVKFDERVNPLQLIALLPVESAPIRSSLFHFEVDEKQGPMIYAKNEFHIRFFDENVRPVDVTRQYIDYQVGEEVDNLTEIKSSQTIERPLEDEIKWFTLQAREGDTISLRASQALTLQVFSPSGKEVYSALGAESVKWGGIHTWEEGTYYVALHDVAGSQSKVTLYYNHMDKYDVVNQDVKIVGNGGCSTITFYGNGFSDLYAVDLVGTSGDTIHCGYIDHISDAVVEVVADFNGAASSMYDGIFHFTGEKRMVNQVMRVQEAKDIQLNSKVSYPKQYLRNTSVTYTLKIQNIGNMTAYRVPLYIYMSSQTEEGIWNIDIDGLNLPKLLDGLDRDSLSAEWLEYEKQIGDGHYFVTVPGYDADVKDSVIVRSGYFFVDIAPNSTKTILLNLTSNEYVDVRFTLPKSMAPMTAKNVLPQHAQQMRTSSSSAVEHYCCIRERVECVGGLIGDAVGFANTIGGLTGIPHAKALAIADCAVGTLNTVISAAGEIACGENNVEESFYEKLKRLKDGISISGTIVGCFEKFLKGSQLLKIGDLSSFIGTATHATTWADCATAFSEKKPNCPPNPGGGGGGSQPVNSFDPNEIYGYLSPSGSKFIAKDSIEAVDYRIEFENDTAFATSSAHVVEIRDTLDARFFELTTFAPTYISIGEKCEQLDGTPNFVRTVDMRPQINTVVQVEGEYDEQTGIARWLFTSLDPMTMEPTDDVMQGFLPVNHDGTSGIGDVAYRIGLKKGLDDGTVITNRASIVFDSNEPILTPTWTNILDGSAPTSAFISVEELNDTVIRLKWKGNDGESPAWRYSLAVQAVEDTEWFEFLTNTTDTVLDYRYYRDTDYGFCVLATDSAGNVESTEWTRKAEFMREYIAGDADKSGAVNLLDLNLTLSYILGNEVSGCDMLQMDVNGDGSINVLDINAILQIILNADGEAATLRKRDNGVIRIINTKVL